MANENLLRPEPWEYGLGNGRRPNRPAVAKDDIRIRIQDKSLHPADFRMAMRFTELLRLDLELFNPNLHRGLEVASLWQKASSYHHLMASLSVARGHAPCCLGDAIPAGRER